MSEPYTPFRYVRIDMRNGDVHFVPGKDETECFKIMQKVNAVLSQPHLQGTLTFSKTMPVIDAVGVENMTVPQLSLRADQLSSAQLVRYSPDEMSQFIEDEDDADWWKV